MKKNNDKRNATLIKAEGLMKVDFDAKQVAETIKRKMEQMPVLTKAELAELFQKAIGFGAEVADKGCWIGLGMFRPEDSEPKQLVQAVGNLTMLALMVAEAMESNPELEKAFLMAVGLKMKFSEDNNEDNEDNNEE